MTNPIIIPKIEKDILFNLKEDKSNPNVMTKEQILSVANSIKKYGFIIPIIVNKDNVIIDGHQRKKAAELLGMDGVPVIRLNVDKVDAKLLKQIMNKLKGTHDLDLDLEEYKFILEEQGNLDLLKEFVAMDDEYINEILLKTGGVDLNLLKDEFNLPDSDKNNLEQITFTLSNIQAEFIKNKLKFFEIKPEYKLDNENKNGNGLYGVFVEWAQQKK